MRGRLRRLATKSAAGRAALVLLIAPIGVGAWPGPGPGQGRQAPAVSRSQGGYETVSPSVAASYSTRRDADGVVSVDVMILWRGSPGWLYRRTGSASASGGGPETFNLYQGGLHLTATFDEASHTVNVLGERVELKGANVVLVDRVDSPDGPVVLKTTTVAPMRSQSMGGVGPILRNTPELLEYLKCEAQIPGGLNHPSMRTVCAEAILSGAVKAPATLHEIPTGPITNRAAGTAPPRVESIPPPGAQSSGSGALSGAVMGGWFLHAEDAGLFSLDLLVLWRGSPGWVMQGDTGGSSGGGANARRGMTVRRGPLSLYAAFETGPRRFQIEQVIKPLGDDNVVLVDEVDSPGGPRVVKTMRVDPAVPNKRIDQLIAKSPELVAYLRCDAKLPDAQKQMMVDILCARYSGK